MPYISTTTNSSITKEQELLLKNGYAKAVTLIGKSENYLMLSFQPDTSMYFAGKSDEPIAFIEVKFFGTSSSERLSRLTAELCKLVANVLSVSPTKIYVKYEEVQNWGWSGYNF